MTTSATRDVALTSSEQPAKDFPGRNVIAVIGIDHYLHWLPLTNAVNDARSAAALFRQLGFEEVAQPLLESLATSEAIHKLVRDDLRTLDPNDSLILFYAGHGVTLDHHIEQRTVKTGYLVPVDASTEVATWIDLEGWLRAVSLLPPRHILVILDACHSGIALGPIIKWRDTGTWQDTALTTLRARRSRRIITSALDDQVALDSGPMHGHSLFTGCLIEGLTYGLANGRNGVTTGSELGVYLQQRVETYPNSRQTPDFGTFDFDERGELIIPLRTPPPAIDDPRGTAEKSVDTGSARSSQVPAEGNHAAPDPLPALEAALLRTSVTGVPSQQHVEARVAKLRRYMLFLIKFVSWFGIPGLGAIIFSYVTCRASAHDKAPSSSVRSHFSEMQSTVTGELSVSGTREGSWSAALSHCYSGQHLGFFGLDLSNGDKVALRVILDPSKGTQVLVRWPRSDKAFELTPETCPGLSAEVHPTNTTYNDIRVLEGALSFDCPLRSGGQAKVVTHFEGCR